MNLTEIGELKNQTQAIGERERECLSWGTKKYNAKTFEPKILLQYKFIFGTTSVSTISGFRGKWAFALNF